MDTQSSTIEVAVPAWLANADQEERAELEALGLVPDAAALKAAEGDAYVDALASKLMRAHHEFTVDVDRYDDACAMEVAEVQARYDALKRPSTSARDRVGSFIQHLASVATFVKTKSRKVGWGVYGMKLSRKRLEISDMDALAAAVEQIEPAAVSLLVELNAYTANMIIAVIDRAIRQQGINGITGVEAAALTFLRAQLKESDRTVTKPIALALAEKQPADQPLPLCTIVAAEDRPYFEVSPIRIAESGTR